MKHLTTKTTFISLAAICAIALIFRMLSIHAVFNHSFVSFIEDDSYSYMLQSQHLQTMLHTSVLSTLHYIVANNQLWSGIVAVLGMVFPMEYVGAWLAPIVGIGAIVVTYFIGSTMFNRLVGLLGALFLALIPSEFFHRTVVGYDTPVAMEVLLMALTVLFSIKALKERRLKWTLLAGIFLSLYLINWKGGVLMVGVLGLFALITGIWWVASHANYPRQPAFTAAYIIIIALLIYLPLGGYEKLLYFLPHTTLPVAASATGEQIATVLTPKSSQTISELMPLLFPFGTFSPLVLIMNLHLFVITFLGGIVLLWKWHKEPDKLLIGVWAISLTVLTLDFRMFLYYLELPVAILSSALIWWVTTKLNLKSMVQNAIALASPLIILSMPMASLIGQSPGYQMSDEWHQDLAWLATQPKGIVTAWSDYGHWIQYETKNTANLLPGPGGKTVAQLYLSTDATTEKSLLDQLGTTYLVADLSTLNEKSNALETISGTKVSDIKATLLYRLLDTNAPQPYLTLEYQSNTIRIFKVGG